MFKTTCLTFESAEMELDRMRRNYKDELIRLSQNDKEVDRAVDLEVDKLMEENEEVSEDYPLGGMIEPYDIWKEDELTK